MLQEACNEAARTTAGLPKGSSWSEHSGTNDWQLKLSWESSSKFEFGILIMLKLSRGNVTMTVQGFAKDKSGQMHLSWPADESKLSPTSMVSEKAQEAIQRSLDWAFDYSTPQGVEI